MRSEIWIRMEGLMLEKLIRRAIDQGAYFKSLRRLDARTIIAETNASGGKILLDLCTKFSIPAEILKEQGKPAILAVLRRRITLIFGIIIFIVLCWMFFSRIWMIDIAFTGESADGNEAVIRSLLQEKGIHPGISNSLDTELLSQTLEASMEGYGFISVRRQGIRLLVEASPEASPPQVYDLNYARDLYAERDGIVVSVNVHSGQAQVKPGDTIKRGQLLIRGEEQIAKEETRSIGALGEVIIRTWFSGTAESSLYMPKINRTGRSSASSRIRLLNRSFPLAEGENYPTQQIETEYLPIGGLFLPLEILRETRYEATKTLHTVNKESLADRLIALSMADAAIQIAKKGPNNYEIARSWINFEQPNGSMLRATAVYEIYTDAAITRDALLQGG